MGRSDPFCKACGSRTGCSWLSAPSTRHRSREPDPIAHLHSICFLEEVYCVNGEQARPGAHPSCQSRQAQSGGCMCLACVYMSSANGSLPPGQFAEENDLYSYFVSARTGDQARTSTFTGNPKGFLVTQVHASFFRIAADLAGRMMIENDKRGVAARDAKLKGVTLTKPELEAVAGI